MARRNRKKHKNRKKGRHKKKRHQPIVKKNNQKEFELILDNIERMTDDLGDTVRNITLTIYKKKIKKKTQEVVIPNIARQRISIFRTGQYKEELLEKAKSFTLCK